MPQHPLPIGTRVRHYGQQWTQARRVGTGNIIDSKGPGPDGSYEYLVRTAEDFSRRSSDDNPETSPRWWASHATIPVVPDPIDRAALVHRVILVDALETALNGGCPACGTEPGEGCTACGSCRCDDHDTCTRP